MKGVTHVLLKFLDSDFKKLNKLKNESGLSWEDFILDLIKGDRDGKA